MVEIWQASFHLKSIPTHKNLNVLKQNYSNTKQKKKRNY